jgi:peptidyl-prolyl cis-trans isomerase C
MNRVFARLLLPVCVVALSAGCQKSNTAAKPADVAGAQTPAAQPSSAKPDGQPGTAAPAAAPGASGVTKGLPAIVPPKPVPTVLPAVVAKVNGEDIQKWEMEGALKQAEAAAGGPVPADKRDVVLRGILDDIVTYHLLAQEAHARKMDVSDADVDAEVLKIRQGFPTEDAYKEALRARGATPEQVREYTRRSMMVNKIVNVEVTTQLGVPDSDVDVFYSRNIDRFKQGEMIHVRHIYFALPPDAPVAERNQKRAAAAEILKQLRAGADFAKLARENSNDATAPNGGDLGFLGQGQMPPDFEKVAFSLKPGTMSGVVELQTGLHIIKVDERRGPRTAPLLEVRDQVKQFLMNEQRQAKIDQLVGQIKAKSKIEILV